MCICDGSTQDIATEAVNEKNGWMTLSAKNFTFSAPTTKVPNWLQGKVIYKYSLITNVWLVHWLILREFCRGI